MARPGTALCRSCDSNPPCGFESDLTIIRHAAERFMVVTGSARATRDTGWIARHIEHGEHAHLTDVSAMGSVLSVMGPQARELLARGRSW